MLYHFFDYLENHYNFFGAGVFKYISFRAGMATVISLLITITLGKTLIARLKHFQVDESIRELGYQGKCRSLEHLQWEELSSSWESCCQHYYLPI